MHNEPSSHDFLFRNVTPAELLNTPSDPATKPYYVAWCSCSAWRSRRFGYQFNNTDSHSKAALDAYHDWRDHSTKTPVTQAQPGLF